MGSTKCRNIKVKNSKSKKKPTVHYRIFQCKELLRRRNPDDISICFSKFLLFETLIAMHPNETNLLNEESEQKMDTEFNSGDK